MNKIFLTCVVATLFAGCNKDPQSISPPPTQPTIKLLSKADLNLAYTKILDFASFVKSSEFSFKNIVSFQERGSSSAEKEYRKWQRKAELFLNENDWREFTELLSFCEATEINTVVNKLKDKLETISDMDDVSIALKDDIKGLYELLQELITPFNKKRSKFAQTEVEKASEEVTTANKSSLPDQ